MFLARIRLISTVSIIEDTVVNHGGGVYKRESNSITYQYGLFSSIKYVKLGFFQSEDFFDKKHILFLNIKKEYLENAKQFIKTIPQNVNTVFVHIRLADYRNFTVYDKPVLLPMIYFHNCIKYFIDTIENSFFVFLSDEPDFITNEFRYLTNKLISFNQHYAVDFAIMTLCSNAILSPSSFGWWGSYLMKNRSIVFAPKYWNGFNTGIDFQKNPLASYMKKIEVIQNTIVFPAFD